MMRNWSFLMSSFIPLLHAFCVYFIMNKEINIFNCVTAYVIDY